ncbi:hypothetical protein [Kineococcus terrestris]|uniref:hypothetical protein n=1 Tax=Kineococcus terrestris TaxID=2044856 RepID=UPI0034DB06AF
MRKDIRCRLGVHRWRDVWDERGRHVCLLCVRCGRDTQETEDVQRLSGTFPGLRL